jgi:hypothetical protein
LADFFGAGAGEAFVAAAPSSFPAAVAAAAAAWAAAASASPETSGGGAVLAAGADGDVVFGVAEAASALADPLCCPAAGGAGFAVVAAFAAAAFAAVAVASFSPPAAIAFKIAALALAPTVLDTSTAALASPVRAVVAWLLPGLRPWLLAGVFEPAGPAVAVDGAGAELLLFAAGALADAALCDVVCCAACCGDCDHPWDGFAGEVEGLTAGGDGLCVVVASKDAKGGESGSWLGVGACIRDTGASESAVLTSDVILGTRELPEATATGARPATGGPRRNTK